VHDFKLQLKTMLHPRNLLIFVGALLLLFGGWFAWHAAHPPLSDEQQIIANVEAIRAAVESRSAGRVQSFLADDFSWNGHNKRELSSEMSGAFFQWRDVTTNITGLHVSISGDTATATGKFSIALRPTSHSRPDAYVGDFTLLWRKRNGQWLITKAKGGENVGG
jgi:ketosteroid isomerase-like protein